MDLEWPTCLAYPKNVNHSTPWHGAALKSNATSVWCLAVAILARCLRVSFVCVARLYPFVHVSCYAFSVALFILSCVFLLCFALRKCAKHILWSYVKASSRVDFHCVLSPTSASNISERARQEHEWSNFFKCYGCIFIHEIQFQRLWIVSPKIAMVCYFWIAFVFAEMTTWCQCSVERDRKVHVLRMAYCY